MEHLMLVVQEKSQNWTRVFSEIREGFLWKALISLKTIACPWAVSDFS
jgi:hypothetical protein